jgi:two-component system LytT family response regulator
VKISALIVDDEPLARERIRSLLQEEPDIEIAGECENGMQAVAALKKGMLDLLFLDVQMPGLDGFGVLRALGDLPLPQVVFVTAYDKHALHAFEVQALDYLLKPFKPGRFKQTLQRARENMLVRRPGMIAKDLLALLSRSEGPRDYQTRIPIRDGEKVIFVKAGAVAYVESAGNYVVLHVGKENLVLRETLTALETKLDPKQFIRISRSALVNVEHIRALQPLFKGEHAVLLQDGKQLTMTRGFREVQELLKFS